MIRRIMDALGGAFKMFRGELSACRAVAQRMVFSVCLLFSAGGGTLAFSGHLTVSASTAAIMDAPAADAQVVGRLPKASVLTATGRKSGDWIEVAAPPSVSGWVYGELVRDNVIAASSVKVRSGPGIGYAALGVLTKGDNIVPRGRNGDWVEIEGLPSFLVWVDQSVMAEGATVDMTAVAPSPKKPESVAVEPPAVPDRDRQLVPPPVPPPAADPMINAVPDAVVHVAPPVDAPVIPPPVKTAPESPRTAPLQETSVAMPPPVRPPVPAPVPARPLPPRRPLIARPAPTTLSPQGNQLPAGLRLLPSAPQGAEVSVSGVLRPVGVTLFSPAGYRLVSADATGPAVTLCYLAGSSDVKALQDRVGAAVVVEGLKYWVLGSREPVVLIRSIR